MALGLARGRLTGPELEREAIDAAAKAIFE
jgi:hypothetical protein